MHDLFALQEKLKFSGISTWSLYLSYYFMNTYTICAKWLKLIANCTTTEILRLNNFEHFSIAREAAQDK